MIKKLKIAVLFLTLILTNSILATADTSSTTTADIDTSTDFVNPVPWNTLGRTVDRPWDILLYHGWLAETSLLNVFTFSSLDSNTNITSLELARELTPCNFLRRYFQPWIQTITFNTNVSYIDDPNGPIYEIDPFFMFHWEYFPWDKYVVNTYGIGWGVSWDSRVSTWEQHDSNNTKQLLNYLAFETTLALPKYPQWQLVLRLHHRSGMFGLYGADNAGSNYVGVGIRYLF